MRINNILEEESFCYTAEKANMDLRADEIDKLREVNEYCRNIKPVKEELLFSESIWEIEVEKGVPLFDWLFSGRGHGRQDDKDKILEIIGKQSYQRDNEESKKIAVALGEWENAVWNRNQYISKRRNILAEITDVQEYCDFMKSCFTQCEFADNIMEEMKYIKDFPERAEEITRNLSVLNDEAMDLYEKHHDNLSEAIKILSVKLLECSNDPKHRKELQFTFTYEECKETEKIGQAKIECSPHLKLFRKDSDLRIYFYWKDDRIGDGKKVLIGRIGRHPY